MTHDVLVAISGIHDMGSLGGLASDEDALEVITPAKYYLRNGKHYILYDEVEEGTGKVTKNTIKITGNYLLEMIKRGVTHSHMIFEAGKSNMTIYDTPYGQFHLETHTRELEILEMEDEIAIRASYRLDMNQQTLSESVIYISVKPKTAKIISH